MNNKEIIKLLKDYRSNVLILSQCTGKTYERARSFVNKNRVLVQQVLTKARVLRYIDVAPPPMIGGYMMRNVNPLDLIFDPPYGLDIYSHIADVIEQAIGIIETDPEFASHLNSRQNSKHDYDVWHLIHPSISEVSKKRMKDGYFADAVESACKVLNSRVRDIVKDQTGEELDGAKLMQKAFSVNNPIIAISDCTTVSGHDTQKGYMEIFAGVMTGIRNPKAHDNNVITQEDALRKLILLSLLMYKIDGRLIQD